MSVENARPCAHGVVARVCAALLSSSILAACSQTGVPVLSLDSAAAAPHVVALYHALPSEKFAIPAVTAEDFDPKYIRRRVRYPTKHPAGTVIVDPDAKFLYLIMADGEALRYGIGVGREGFGWSGTAQVARKAQWPTWTPPAQMIGRQPELEKYRKGMEPGLGNPLGARALYLYQNGRDTLYRIHGTNEPGSIGTNVSSGCIRLLNQDVIDLFGRVPVGSRVVVLAHGQGNVSSNASTGAGP
jgi:lipoprotein-anchoring transpeptidase ErfK/SrfK